MSGLTYEQRIFNRLATVYRPTRSEAATIAKEADAEIASLTASLASAQQRIAELERDAARIDWCERMIAEKSAVWMLPCGEDLRFVQLRHFGDCDNYPTVSGLRAALDAAMDASAVATATRPSKGFLKGESPQATWPFAQDDKGTVK